MKQNKGEAAFESVDEVLAEKIVKNSRDHGKKTQEAAHEPSTTGNKSAPAGKTVRSSAAKWVIAVAIATLVMLIGSLFFGTCKKRLFK